MERHQLAAEPAASERRKRDSSPSFAASAASGTWQSAAAVSGQTLTEYEEVLVCLMRSHRAYDVKTLGSIWRRTSEGWATRIFQKWMPKLGRIGLFMSILDRDFMLDYVSVEVAREKNLPHSQISVPDGEIKNYAEKSLQKEYEEKGEKYQRVGAIVDGKVFMTDNINVNSALNRLMYSDKTDNSGGLVMTWSSPMGLVFEHTGLYFARRPETRLIELWATEDPENMKLAVDPY